jgi:diguanylate cyclase (GGDEF)-like protein
MLTLFSKKRYSMANDKSVSKVQTKKWRILYNLLAISIFPMCLLGIVILVLGSRCFKQTMYNEVASELEYVAKTTEMLFDTSFPGDYELVGDSSYRLYKGDTDITENYDIINQIQESTGMDITLFYKDTRILTTILSSDGSSIVGTGAPTLILDEVLGAGEAKFYHNAMINGDMYFAYYMPLFNSDGNVAGMLFVGKPRDEVDKAVMTSLYPLIIAVIAAIIVMAVCIYMYNRKLVAILINIRDFLSETASGNLTADMNEAVTRRNDELGQIGLSILTMQKSLRTMVETDTLTGLPNRRSAHRRLEQIMERAQSGSSPYCIAIGDIDFFKRINDTYGHDCGDAALQQIAHLLQGHMKSCGFASRWGGEEFLLVFDHMGIQAADASLNKLLDKIRECEIPYDGQTIKLTMTFGLAQGSDIPEKNLLRTADSRLYKGKTSGRNQVVSFDD